MKLIRNDIEFFVDTVNEVLAVPEVHLMHDYMQHGTVSCLMHCITVAHNSFKMAKNLNLKIDFRSLIRGAMLHDFFLYDWHDKNNGIRLHGYKHPKIALKNSMRYFELNKIEQDIIKKHMWPLTLCPPLYKESFLVSVADKVITVSEICKLFKDKFSLLNKKISYNY